MKHKHYVFPDPERVTLPTDVHHGEQVTTWRSVEGDHFVRIHKLSADVVRYTTEELEDLYEEIGTALGEPVIYGPTDEIRYYRSYRLDDGRMWCESKSKAEVRERSRPLKNFRFEQARSYRVETAWTEWDGKL